MEVDAGGPRVLVIRSSKLVKAESALPRVEELEKQKGEVNRRSVADCQSRR